MKAGAITCLTGRHTFPVILGSPDAQPVSVSPIPCPVDNEMPPDFDTIYRSGEKQVHLRLA